MVAEGHAVGKLTACVGADKQYAAHHWKIVERQGKLPYTTRSELRARKDGGRRA